MYEAEERKKSVYLAKLSINRLTNDFTENKFWSIFIYLKQQKKNL